MNETEKQSISAMRSMFGANNVQYAPDIGTIHVYGSIPGTNFVDWYLYGYMNASGLVVRSKRCEYFNH